MADDAQKPAIIARNLRAGRDVVVQIINNRYGRGLFVAGGLLAAAIVILIIRQRAGEEARLTAVRRDTEEKVRLAATEPGALAEIKTLPARPDRGAIADGLVAGLNDPAVRQDAEVGTAVVRALESLCLAARRDRVCPALLALVELPDRSGSAPRPRWPREVHDQALETLRSPSCRRCPDLGPHMCHYLRVLTQGTLERVVLGAVIATGPEDELAQGVLQSLEGFACP
jgi:hypothetical protein